ncbi:hypothetical protein R3W88_033289 [Solanum pinnatisectum]|uniref:DUF4283 domain-containing protein n=1 Tax=Solanum pinnatisectum TaxID=50273 RepID=A0AAV9K3I5_9SOLN|nr:hypothetical protein R3W88_033289 [Solanum pinnatisectum]
MAAAASPQSQTVGESNLNNTHASLMNYNPTALTKTILKPIQLIHREPTVRFTFKELDEYAVEEGLHQAVIMKLSFGAPSLHELRKLIPKQLVIKGRCLIGSLAARHLLIRCDLYEDFCSVLSKQFGYLQFNGEQHMFRNFPWTQNFNPKEETSKALAWVSLLDLPPNLFARRPLLSIASAIGKPIAIDKATQDRTRPSTARVKVILDLMDKHPKRVRMHFLDEQSGKLVEHYQQVVFDNLPFYCTYCKHQGHEDDDCRLMIQKNKRGEGNQDEIRQQGDKTNNLEQLQGDARDFLNAKKKKKLKIKSLMIRIMQVM